MSLGFKVPMFRGVAAAGGGGLPPAVNLPSLIAAFIPSGYTEASGDWVDTNDTYVMTQATSSARPVYDGTLNRVEYQGNDFHVIGSELLTALSSRTAITAVRICTAESASQYYFLDIIATGFSHRILRQSTNQRAFAVDWNSGGGGVALAVADIADAMSCRTEVANRNSALLSGQGATWSSGSSIANADSPTWASGWFGSFAGSSNYQLADYGLLAFYGAALTQAQHDAIREACSDNEMFGCVGVTL